MTRELNKVDQHIKQLMLSYPTIMPSRFAVLKHLFMTNGSDHYWTPLGELKQVDDTIAVVDKMDFSDLEDRAVSLEEAESVIDQRLYEIREERLWRDTSIRVHIANNIDLYATEHVMGEDVQYGVDWLSHFDPHWCRMVDAPYDYIDQEWALAAEEILQIAKQAIWRKLGRYSDTYERRSADYEWLTKYDGICEILDKLDKTTGTKARCAAANERIRVIIDEILRDEGAL